MSVPTALALFRRQTRTYLRLDAQQCRTLILHYAVHAVTTLGIHDFKNWNDYDYPTRHQFSVNLWDLKLRKRVGESDLPLVLMDIKNSTKEVLAIENEANAEKRDALRSAIFRGDLAAQSKAFKVLAPLLYNEGPKKKSKEVLEAEEKGMRRFTIRPLKIRKSPKLSSKQGYFKRFFFNSGSCMADFFEVVVGKMNYFMQHGVAIEVAIVIKHGETFEKFIEENPHLHPDALLSAMPPGSRIILKPKTDGQRKVVWIMGSPRLNNDGTYIKPKSLEDKWVEMKAKVLRDLELSAQGGFRGDIIDQSVAKKYNRRLARLSRLSRNPIKISKERTEWSQQPHEDAPFEGPRRVVVGEVPVRSLRSRDEPTRNLVEEGANSSHRFLAEKVDSKGEVREKPLFRTIHLG